MIRFPEKQTRFIADLTRQSIRMALDWLCDEHMDNDIVDFFPALANVSVGVRKMMGVNEETWGLVSELKPHPDELKCEIFKPKKESDQR